MDKGITSITVRTCLLIFLSGKGVLRLRSSSPNNIEVDVHDRSAKRQKLLENNPFLDLEAVAEDEEDPETPRAASGGGGSGGMDRSGVIRL